MTLLALADVSASMGVRATPSTAQDNGGEELVTVELSTVGFDRVAAAPIVLLRDPTSGSVVPIWIGAAEAQSIVLALHGVEVPRPMTHDLMANVLSELGAEIEEVVVHDLKDNVYLGRLRLRLEGEKELRTVDSRPSDALALAVRTGAAIRVARKILRAPPRFDFMAPESSGQVVHILGITVVSPTPALRKEFSLPERAGVVVTHAAGRAQEKGLRRGDLITEVNGGPVQEPMDFLEIVRTARPGSLIRVTYLRGSVEGQLDLPADLPPPPRPAGPLVRRDYSPTIWMTMSRSRPRVSNSRSTICCHVPSASVPLENGTVIDGPTSAART
jgi:bifunctional DNase/RNase